MLKIPVPESSYGDIEVALGGQTYTFTFRFNERGFDGGNWKLDIYNQDSSVVQYGLTMVDGSSPMSFFKVTDFDHGYIFIGRTFETSRKCTRDNFGIGKDYELYYVNLEELE